MTGDPTFDEINDAKANMDHIYDRSDPRAYFRELKSVGYTIPGEAKPIFQKLIGHLQNKTNDTVRVLDIGCSYGINAALLKYDLSIDNLYDHWGRDNLACIFSHLPPEDLLGHLRLAARGCTATDGDPG